MEIWKEVKNYEGYYEVSNLGRVRSVDHYSATGILHSDVRLVKGRILKQHLKRSGYFTADLSKGNKVKTILVHRLVALAFLEGEGEQIDHINGKKVDNRVENLEWVSTKTNIRRAHAMGLMKPHGKDIYCVELKKTFKGSYRAAEFLNETYFKNSKQVKIMAAKIRACALGMQKKAYGFTWRHL